MSRMTFSSDGDADSFKLRMKLQHDNDSNNDNNDNNKQPEDIAPSSDDDVDSLRGSDDDEEEEGDDVPVKTFQFGSKVAQSYLGPHREVQRVAHDTFTGMTACFFALVAVLSMMVGFTFVAAMTQLPQQFAIDNTTVGFDAPNASLTRKPQLEALKDDLTLTNYTMHFWNVTNPVEYLAGTQPPSLVPVGPFLKRTIKTTSANVTFSDDGKYVQKRMGGVGTIEFIMPDNVKPSDRLYLVNKFWFGLTFGDDTRLLLATVPLVLPPLYSGLVAMGAMLNLTEPIVLAHWSSCALGAPVGDLNPLAKAHYPIPFEFGCWAKQRAAADPSIPQNATVLSAKSARAVLGALNGTANPVTAPAYATMIHYSFAPDAKLSHAAMAYTFGLNSVEQASLVREYVGYISKTYGVAVAKSVMGPPLGPKSTGIVLNRTVAEFMWQYEDPLFGVVQAGFGPKKNLWCFACYAVQGENLGGKYQLGEPVDWQGGVNASYLPPGYVPHDPDWVDDKMGPWQHTGKGDIFAWSSYRTYEDPLQLGKYDATDIVRSIKGEEVGKYEDFLNVQSIFVKNVDAETLEFDIPFQAGFRDRLTRDPLSVPVADAHLAGYRYRRAEGDLIGCDKDTSRHGCGVPAGFYRPARGAWDMLSVRAGYETALIPPSAQTWPSGFMQTMGDLHRADERFVESIFPKDAGVNETAAETRARYKEVYPGIDDERNDKSITVWRPMATTKADIGFTVEQHSTVLELCGVKPSPLHPTVWYGNPTIGNYTWLPCGGSELHYGLTDKGSIAFSVLATAAYAISGPIVVIYCIMIPLLYCLYKACFRLDDRKRSHLRHAMRSYTRGDVLHHEAGGTISSKAVKVAEEKRKLHAAARRITIAVSQDQTLTSEVSKAALPECSDGADPQTPMRRRRISRFDGEKSPTSDETVESWLTRLMSDFQGHMKRAVGMKPSTPGLKSQLVDDDADEMPIMPPDDRPRAPPRMEALRRMSQSPKASAGQEWIRLGDEAAGNTSRSPFA